MMSENSNYLFLRFRAKKGNTPIEVAHPFGFYLQLDLCNDDNLLVTGPLFLRFSESKHMLVSKAKPLNTG